jgi:hypothetical protein
LEQNYCLFISISLSHEGQNPPFLGHCMSSLVKDSRQFKQREKRLLKVVTVNLPLIIQTITTTKKLYFVVRRLSNVGETNQTVPQNGGKIGGA